MVTWMLDVLGQLDTSEEFSQSGKEYTHVYLYPPTIGKVVAAASQSTVIPVVPLALMVPVPDMALSLLDVVPEPLVLRIESL